MTRATWHDGRGRAAGTMLLEVVVAVALLILGLGVIGVQFKYANLTAHKNQDVTTAMMLAESKCAEIVASTLELEEVQEGDFGEAFPDFFWRLEVEPAEIEGLERYQLEIYQGDAEEITRVEERQLVHTSYWLRAEQENLNLARDFGLTDEQIAQLTEVMPLENFDPADLDPGLLADLDEDALAQIVPQLLETLGMGDMTGSGSGSEFFTLASMLSALAPRAGGGGDAGGEAGAGRPGRLPTLPGVGSGGSGDQGGRGGAQPAGRGMGRRGSLNDSRSDRGRRGASGRPGGGGSGQPGTTPSGGDLPKPDQTDDDNRSRPGGQKPAGKQPQRKPLEK